MRILWVHNVPTNIVSAGAFVFDLAEEVRRQGIHLDLYATGSLRSGCRLAAARCEITGLSRNYDICARIGSACAHVTARAKCRKIVSRRGTDLLGCDTGSPW